MTSRILFSLVLGLLVASIGCYLAATLIPAGSPRLIAEMLAVMVGLGPAATTCLREF